MKKLIPPFLKQLDQYLLLNNPLIWITKIHYVLFFGIFFWVLSAGIGFIIPLNLQNTQDLGLWNFLFSILAIVAFCFWVYYNVIFNIEKQFGNRHWTDIYKLFFIYALCCFIFFGFSIPFSVVYNNRVADVVTDRELIEDMNTLNTAEPYMVNDVSAYDFVKRDSLNGKDFYDIRKCVRFGNYTPWEIKYDTIKFPNLLSEYQLQKQYQLLINERDIKAWIDKQYQVQVKYGLLGTHNQNSDYANKIYAHYKKCCENSPIEYTYLYNNENTNNKYDLEIVMRNISDAKFSKLYVWKQEYLIFMMYLCFYLSILLLLFKMANWKQYLITAVSFVLIPIILFIFSQLLPYQIFGNHNRGNFYLILLILTTLVAIGFCIKSVFYTKRFGAFGNICAQISYVVLPLLPLMLFVIIKDTTMSFFNQNAMAEVATASYENMDLGKAPFPIQDTNAYYNTPEYLYSQMQADYWREQFMIWQSICLFGGIILFIVVLLPLFHKLFVKQLSLPRKS